MFWGDFLQGGMGCLALSCSVQQASLCCFNLKECSKHLLQGCGAWLCSPAQPPARCGGPVVRAELPRKPGVRMHTPCPSPGAAALAGVAASCPVLSPGQAVDALGDGDT